MPGTFDFIIIFNIEMTQHHQRKSAKFHMMKEISVTYISMKQRLKR